MSANHTFTLAQVVNTDNEVSGNTINLSNTTASTSSTTGALRVGGGVGVGANLHVGGNVYVGQMETSTIASNVVTWDATTGRLTDSAGLISNKLAVVSEVPASALSASHDDRREPRRFRRHRERPPKQLRCVESV